MRILMCGSNLHTVRGGMVSVVEGYLGCGLWKKSQIRYIPTHTTGGKLWKSAYFAGAYVRIACLLAGKRVDVVHLHIAERGSFYRKAFLVRLCKALRVPVILHHHGAEFEDFYGKMNEKQREYVGRILELADCNLVLSGTLEAELKKKAPRAKTMVLHNAVSVPAQRSYTLEGNRILMMGCQGWRKGSYDLLEAAARIQDRLPEQVQLWLCGDGDVEGVQKRAEELGLSGRVVVTGWIGGARREECLANAMLHVLPSYREALPMSILETMGRGIPNIATAIASIPEVIRDGETGLLIQPGEVEALSAAILRLAEDAGLREEISAKSYALMAESFSLSACTAKLEDLYESLLRQRQTVK